MDTDNNRYLTYNLEQDAPQILSQDEFEACYQGQLILVTSRASVVGQLAKFDFTWFIPAVIKYRKIFLETLIVSNLFANFCPNYTAILPSCYG